MYSRLIWSLDIFWRNVKKPRDWTFHFFSDLSSTISKFCLFYLISVCKYTATVIKRTTSLITNENEILKKKIIFSILRSNALGPRNEGFCFWARKVSQKKKIIEEIIAQALGRERFGETVWTLRTLKKNGHHYHQWQRRRQQQHSRIINISSILYSQSTIIIFIPSLIFKTIKNFSLSLSPIE